MEKNLYRDTANGDDPVRIERDLARFEGEISKIIRERFLYGDKVVLTPEENEKLLLFFAIMGFRSKNTSMQFEKGMSKQGRIFYSHYQNNGKLSDLWKRNLSSIVNCRSLSEVIEHPDIDDPFKVFFMRDTFGFFGRYLVIAERKDSEAFIIGDTYPVEITGELDNGINLNMFSLFPISPNRIIIVANNGVEGAPRDVRVFRECVLRKPRMDNNDLILRVKRIYSEEVNFINAVIKKEAREGIIFSEIFG